jgi:DNA-dependent RNA polymerase auxiliary subunit epsilon
MFKRLLAICLLVALICSSFSRFFVYAGFEANSKYIAKNLCVNKSRPWMHCNGKCYLMNKLKLAEEKERKQQRENSKSLYQEAMVSSALRLTLKPVTFKINYPKRLTAEVIQQSVSIFQPPKLAFQES